MGIAEAPFYFIGRSRAKKEVTKYAAVEPGSKETPSAINSEDNIVPQRSFPGPGFRNELWSPMSPVDAGQYMTLSEKPPLRPPIYP